MPAKTLSKVLALYLILSLFALTLPAPGWAMFIPSDHAAGTRTADLARLQSALESTVIKQRLMDYGLSPQDAAARLSLLSDEQIHDLSSRMDSVQAGGIIGEVIFLLVVAIIVVVVLEATGHRVIIKR
jgi:hypothetical protein